MASNSTIDLTDEDDARPQRNAQNNPPALVALNMRNRKQIVQQPVQRQLGTTQQTIRNAAIISQNRKLPVVGKRPDHSYGDKPYDQNKIFNKSNNTIFSQIRI